ncbi:MAG TPA: hypothetical protein VNM37_28570 [Candidatus Dormibacteraeota bacterium]|nr:hypothetical protein [Candidatus Dormibacteraeota bacterium]
MTIIITALALAVDGWLLFICPSRPATALVVLWVSVTILCLIVGGYVVGRHRLLGWCCLGVGLFHALFCVYGMISAIFFSGVELHAQWPNHQRIELTGAR